MSDEKGVALEQSTVDVLLAARDVYAEQGGGKGADSGHFAPYCALGALKEATGAVGPWSAYYSAPGEALREAVIAIAGHDRVDAYNDNIDALNKKFSAERHAAILDLYDEAIRWAKDNDHGSAS